DARYPGEDYDNAGVFDVFERDLNHDGIVNPNEDLDGDGRFTPPSDGTIQGGCEGRLREDQDCDGVLDFVNEDLNGNGRLDPGEDIDGDRRLDLGTEDRNHNQFLDDTPRPTTLYPYGELKPLAPDREYVLDQRTRITGGPYYNDFSDRRGRFTLRQDLSVHVPDYWGTHDLKFGLSFERESFGRRIESRGILAEFVPRSVREGPGSVKALIPAESDLHNSALGLSGGVYLQDSYKPFPNLSLGVGLRLDRERIDTFGYSFLEPAAARALYDRLPNRAGAEPGRDALPAG